MNNLTKIVICAAAISLTSMSFAQEAYYTAPTNSATTPNSDLAIPNIPPILPRAIPAPRPAPTQNLPNNQDSQAVQNFNYNLYRMGSSCDPEDGGWDATFMMCNPLIPNPNTAIQPNQDRVNDLTVGNQGQLPITPTDVTNPLRLGGSAGGNPQLLTLGRCGTPPPAVLSTYAGLTNADFIFSMYRLMLGRDPTDAEITRNLNEMSTPRVSAGGPGNVLAGVSYQASRADIISSIIASQEYKGCGGTWPTTFNSTCGSYPRDVSADLDNTAFTNTVLLRMLGRPASAEETARYVTLLTDGSVTRTSLVYLISTSAEFQACNGRTVSGTGITSTIPPLPIQCGSFASPVDNSISNRAFIEKSFLEMLGAPAFPNYENLAGSLLNDLNTGRSGRGQVISAIYASPDWQICANVRGVRSPTYGTCGDSYMGECDAVVDDTQYTACVYRIMLGREPETGGLQTNINFLARGNSRTALLSTFYNSAEWLNCAGSVPQLCPNMQPPQSDGTCPVIVTQTCWNGSVIPVTLSCPPEATQFCPDGRLIPITQICSEFVGELCWDNSRALPGRPCPALPPSQTCWDGSVIPLTRTCPALPTQTCWNGTVLPITTQCPPLQLKICWDNSAIPINQDCPTIITRTCWNNTIVPVNRECPPIPTCLENQTYNLERLRCEPSSCPFDFSYEIISNSCKPNEGVYGNCGDNYNGRCDGETNDSNFVLCVQRQMIGTDPNSETLATGLNFLRSGNQRPRYIDSVYNSTTWSNCKGLDPVTCWDNVPPSGPNRVCNPEPTQVCWNGSVIPQSQTCPPIPTQTCWNGTVLPITQQCPPIPSQTCWDGQVIPVNQSCRPIPNQVCWNGNSIPITQQCPPLPTCPYGHLQNTSNGSCSPTDSRFQACGSQVNHSQIFRPNNGSTVIAATRPLSLLSAFERNERTTYFASIGQPEPVYDGFEFAVRGAYWATFGRAASTAEARAWAVPISQNTIYFPDFIETIYRSAEWQACAGNPGPPYYGAPGNTFYNAVNIPRTGDLTQDVITLYRKILGREPDSQGLINSVAAVNNGIVTFDQLLSAFVNSQEANIYRYLTAGQRPGL